MSGSVPEQVVADMIREIEKVLEKTSEGESGTEVMPQTQTLLSPQPSSSNTRITGDLDDIPVKYAAAEMNASDLELKASSSSSRNSDISNLWESFNRSELSFNDTCKTEFTYNDMDTLENELGEIYGYYELSSMTYNYAALHDYLEKKKIDMDKWWTLGFRDKCNFFDDLLDDLEQADKFKQSDALIAISYLVQGCWRDLETASEQLQNIEENVALLLHCNGFLRMCSFLSCHVMFQVRWDSKSAEWGISERMMENCLNVMCTITTVAFMKKDVPLNKEFIADLRSQDGDSILVEVFDCFTRCVTTLGTSSFLIKKLLLLARNILLLSAGGTEDLRRQKEIIRKRAGLKPSKEDTILNCQDIDILQKSSHWIGMKIDQNRLMTTEDLIECTRRCYEAEKQFSIGTSSKKTLPWSPKSSIENLRNCIKDFKLQMIFSQNVPVPVNQRYQMLVENLYVPLSTFHLQQEKLIRDYPGTFKSQEEPFLERIDEIFSALMPSIQAIMNSMMLVLSDATPQSNPSRYHKKDNLDLPFIPRVEADFKYPVEDSKRQAEIIVKAVSTILILLLKYTKLNHIYQFECIASEIMAVNYLPTMLRFFNRDVQRHLSQRPVLEHVDCPFKAIHVDLCLSHDSDSSTDGMYGLSWRNTFSHINLLRVSNKIVKGKPSRILMLRMFKAHFCFTRALDVRNSLFQQYVLKLLKLQCKFLDPEWKRNNQRIISAIYHKVRHRLLDDWIGEISSSTKVKKRSEQKIKPRKWPWEYSSEEFALHEDIISYLQRRYGESSVCRKECNLFFELEDHDNSSIDIPESFKKNYEEWLDKEVLTKNVDWDQFLHRLSI